MMHKFSLWDKVCFNPNSCSLDSSNEAWVTKAVEIQKDNGGYLTISDLRYQNGIYGKRESCYGVLETTLGFEESWLTPYEEDSA